MNPGVQPDIAALLAPYCDRYAWLIPSWCQRVFVRFEESQASGNETTDIATTVTNKTYRWATIRFHGGFLADSDLERRIDTVHEILHISLSSAIDYGRQAVKDLAAVNQSLSDHVGQQLCALHEQGVQDLAYAIVKAEENG
jgi:hypothetical protein